MYKINHYETPMEIKIIEGLSLNRVNENLKGDNPHLTILAFLKKNNEEKTMKKTDPFIKKTKSV